MQGRADVSGPSVEEATRLVLANQSIKKFVDPEDIGALALFLAGKHGRSISGQMLPIIGDSKAEQSARRTVCRKLDEPGRAGNIRHAKTSDFGT